MSAYTTQENYCIQNPDIRFAVQDQDGLFLSKDDNYHWHRKTYLPFELLCILEFDTLKEAHEHMYKSDIVRVLINGNLIPIDIYGKSKL